MAIRWDDFPHQEIRLRIYARLSHNAMGRSAEDSRRHVLRRRLASLDSEVHQRFVELEAWSLVEHLRCTRDVYREFVESKGCRLILEAQWVVLRCAVFPTAIAILRQRVIEYAKLSRVPGRDLSLLFGILTRTCYESAGNGIGLMLMRPPDLDDETAATDDELESLARLVHEDSLLWFRDIRDGGAVGQPFGGGPFSTDDQITIHNSWALCALRAEITLPEWLTLRKKVWRSRAPWTEGLCSLFGAVQEELLSQWRALPSDSLVHELEPSEQVSEFQSIVVPARGRTTRGIRTGMPRQSAEETPGASGSPKKKKTGREARLPEEFVVYAGKLWRKAISGANNNVKHEQLRAIAVALDEASQLPPAAFLEGKYAQDVKDFNSRNSNSKIGPIRTWCELVSHGDKEHLRGMRRLLSRCAEKLNDNRTLSGN
jgi:hypothetical protein